MNNIYLICIYLYIYLMKKWHFKDQKSNEYA